jgi:hypothetical protein
MRGAKSAPATRAHVGHLDRLASHLNLSMANRGLQAVGQAQSEGWNVGRVHINALMLRPKATL